jgi:hypothetical protein
MMSRFDFLVQERAISTQEERQYAELLATGDSDKLPPHRTAALEALRKLTGKNADPNAAAWRAILKMP